ncbi:MAG: hypothetical protein ACLQUY_10135 [Ktedonobacterales bacterium]
MPSHRKGATGRDYAAEYASRIARSAERGLSRSQARGHAAAGESISELREAGVVTTTGNPYRDRVLLRYYHAVRELGQGKSLRQAARTAGISPSTVRRYNEGRQLYQPVYRYKNGQPTTVKGYQVEQPGSTPILTREGILIVAPPVDAKNASLLGRYWNAVDTALHGDARTLHSFAHTTIYDVNGNTYQLMTDVNAIYRFFDGMSDEDQADFWRNFYAGRTVIYAPAA